MYKLPLFPLNTVLFPGTPIFLHIFEDRYKAMIERCLAEKLAFGVFLIAKGVEAYGEAEPCRVGCTAQIMQVERLNEGRMNLVAVGRERIVLDSIERTEPYLQGAIKPYPPLATEPTNKLEKARKQLEPSFKQYAKLLQQAGKLQLNLEQTPEDPIELAYWTAFAMQIPPERKQALLELNDPLQLLEDVSMVCRSEISLVKAMLEHVRIIGDDNLGDIASLN